LLSDLVLEGEDQFRIIDTAMTKHRSSISLIADPLENCAGKREDSERVHNKVSVIDSGVVAVGFGHRNEALRNRDSSVIILNERAAKYYEQIFLHDWQNVAS
jgi:hypothetical protein